MVETVKGYAKHEQKTLTAVIEARNIAMNTSGIAEKDRADRAFEGTLKSLFALSEAYPELKANKNFEHLQDQLTKLESDILQARKYYNAVVKTYNDKCQVIPSNIIAKLGHFEPKEMFIVDEASERQNVKVEF